MLDRSLCCAAFASLTLILPLPLSAAPTCHDNYLNIWFYDESGASLSLDGASGALTGYNETSGQSCGGPHEMNGPDWCGSGVDKCEKNSAGGDYGLQFLYHAGRKKSKDISDYYKDWAGNNPSLGLGLSEDQTSAAYFPDEMNMLMGFDIYNIDIGNGRLLSIYDVVIGQGSQSSGIKAIFDIIKDAGETAFYAYEGELVDTLKSFTSLVGDSVDLKYENNWYLSQDNPNVYMTSYNSDAALVLYGEDQNGTVYPVLIYNGGSDNDFHAKVLTGDVTSSSLSTAQHVGVGSPYYFDPSVGIFSRERDSRWIDSLHLGPLYEADQPDFSGNGWEWLYSEKFADWLMWNPVTYPGFYYSNHSRMIYQYDPAKMGFIPRPDLEVSGGALQTLEARDLTGPYPSLSD
ncbi:hypothetical protein U5801_11985 [Lamprobacter modestohalophilus]|uniref:hypothetical protein n=1 Tax=Lamprobacter modestohalophilus TaxID=1064514 RepID=UPI002ADEADFA|nr:hypothetical protein [Lamprobacter modestohalophilus]MEA1050524.1 hypothetical protein [Lamprobacter modestohalophilus]